jgi:uncharacterized membrane protein
MEILNVVAILVAGLMVGCELAIAAFIHPTLDKLSDSPHLQAASAIARVMGSVMPFWYILTLLLTLAEVAIRWPASGRLPIWIAVSAALWVLTIVYTLIALVPVNNRIRSWETATPPPDWKSYRRSWDRPPWACCPAHDCFRVSDCGSHSLALFGYAGSAGGFIGATR